MSQKNINSINLETFSKEELVQLLEQTLNELSKFTKDGKFKDSDFPEGQEIIVGNKHTNNPLFFYNDIIGEKCIIHFDKILSEKEDDEGNKIPFITIHLKSDHRKRKKLYFIHPEDAIFI